MMKKIIINCPECGQKLAFYEVPGYENMLVECPKCHFKANASVYQAGKSTPGNSEKESADTELSFKPSVSSGIGQIRVVSNGVTAKLKEGSNVIGRDVPSGNADIKITQDEYMSRRHAQIDVVNKNGGYEHRLVEINSKNIVKLNGIAIGRGDILKLKFGDVLTLGNTEIVFENSDEDATVLK